MEALIFVCFYMYINLFLKYIMVGKCKRKRKNWHLPHFLILRSRNPYYLVFLKKTYSKDSILQPTQDQYDIFLIFLFWIKLKKKD